MVWRVVSSMAPLLSKEFRDAHEELNKVLRGSKKSEDLWKRCIGEADEAIGMALGSLFIEKAFEGSSKQEVSKTKLKKKKGGKEPAMRASRFHAAGDFCARSPL